MKKNKEEFDRIYWLDKFNWEDYSRVYNKYCKTKDNYYLLTAKSLVDSANIKENSLVVDLACGTGILTKILLERFPKLRIIAIDLSKEALNFYKNNFKQQINSGQIKVIQGNAENINELVKEKVDFIFITSALWNLKSDILFRNISSVMKPNTKIIVNFHSIAIGEEKGLIYQIERFFEKEAKIEKFFKRIAKDELEQQLKFNLLNIEITKEYSFVLSKKSLREFFELTNLRFPFIFFSEEFSYEETFQICKNISKKFSESISGKGIQETGYVFVIGLNIEEENVTN